MNRMEEYQDLMQEIDMHVPELENTLTRAHRKKARRDRIRRPIVGLTSAFALFVLLVNFCTPVAYACSKIPFIKELAEAVTFSRSLTDAVDNEYVQPIYLEQTDGDVTATVEYLIVDQKQVNIFFRLQSEKYTALSVEPEIVAEDYSWLSHSCGVNDFNVPNGKLQSVTVDFSEEDVPGKLRLLMDIRDQSLFLAMPVEENVTNALSQDFEPDTTDYVASFDFLLEFDPAFTATGKVIPVNQTVVLDGNEIMITDMEIYPTHLRVNVDAAEENEAWLKGLYFYIETDWGMKFDKISNGITATGSTNTPAMVSFRTDSSYFYDAKHLKIVITGAEWLDKDREKVYVNLMEGEIEWLPEGVELDAIEYTEEGWEVRVKAIPREPHHCHQIFSMVCYDMEGNERFDVGLGSYGIVSSDSINENDKPDYFSEFLLLQDYPDDEVWICPIYSHEWFAEEPISIVVQ